MFASSGSYVLEFPDLVVIMRPMATDGPSKRLRPARLREVIPVEAKGDVV
jgi:hypothetical protein